MALKVGGRTIIPVSIPQAILVANTSVEVVSPVDGWIDELLPMVQAAVTTGGTLTVLTGDAGATTVAGIAPVIANSATKGTRVTAATKSTRGSDTRYVTKGTRIQIKPTSFATAGAVDCMLCIASADDSAAL